MTTSSANLRSPAVPATEPPEHNGPRGERALHLLQSAHPELLSALQTHAGDEECTLNVSALPRHSRQLLWDLYKTHDPELAAWMRTVAAARNVMDATLCLNAREILQFLEINSPDIEPEAAAASP